MRNNFLFKLLRLQNKENYLNYFFVLVEYFSFISYAVPCSGHKNTV